MTVNEALSAVNLLSQMTDQGFAFYNQLNDWLNRSKQNIEDFSMTRKLEKDDLVKSLGGGGMGGGPPQQQPPQMMAPQQQQQYGMPQPGQQ